MTLRRKISLVSSITMFVVMIISSALILLFINKSLKHNDDIVIENAMNMCKINVETLLKSDLLKRGENTTKAMVQYHFRRYVDYTKSNSMWYNLVYKEEILFDNRFGKMSEAMLTKTDTLDVGDNQYEITIYKSTQTTATTMKNLAVFLITLTMIASGVLFFSNYSFIRIATNPIELVTKTALSIAEGAYEKRTNYQAKDEIGALSFAFDKMAQAIDSELAQRKFLLGALTHELKTPMTSIIGSADTVMHMPISEEQKEKCMQMIFISAKRTENLAKSMMEFISYSDYHATISPINTAYFAQILEDIYGDTIRIISLDEQLYADETLLYCLCTNLIDNALKYGKNVVITLENRRITVEDNGVGIPKEQIPHITKPFYRVDKSRARNCGGAGIGLALCEMIAKAHDGNLLIESELNKGTKVSFSWGNTT